MEPLPTYRIVLPVVTVVGLSVFCFFRNVPRFRAMLLGIAMMSAYGMLQDQVSARLCPEYFTAMHPPIRGLSDPTLLGIAWGFLASWWGGALLGYLAGIVATSGTKHPPLPIQFLVKPMLLLLAVVGFVTALTGFTVWRHAELFEIRFESWVSHVVPPDRQQNAFVVACYHFTAYVISVAGGVVLCVGIGIRRRKRT